jgi:erythromycin esterase
MSAQAKTIPAYSTLEEWIHQEAIPFSLDSEESLNAAADQLIASLDDAVELLGLGEPTHGIEDFLILRNRLFQRLVEAHGYTAIAIESSFPRGYLANEYILGRSSASYEEVMEKGFSHSFGQWKANHELIEWMRQYNADSWHPVKLHFYGFDSPTEMYGTDSPRQVLEFVLDYLATVDPIRGERHRQRIEPLLGEDATWEHPETLMDATKSIGLSAEAAQLRIETEELIAELQIHRPDWVAKSGKDHYLEALQYAFVARQLLTYHAGLAGQADDRFIRQAGLRDAMMADILAYIVSRERERGKVLAFAHNSHLKRGRAEWQLGPDLHRWWPAGAHLSDIFGTRYAVIGTGTGTMGAGQLGTPAVGKPEAGTLEAALIDSPGPVRFIPTHDGEHLPSSVVTALPVRSASYAYSPLTAQSFTDFDWLCVLDAARQRVNELVVPG